MAPYYALSSLLPAEAIRLEGLRFCSAHSSEDEGQCLGFESESSAIQPGHLMFVAVNFVLVLGGTRYARVDTFNKLALTLVSLIYH